MKEVIRDFCLFVLWLRTLYLQEIIKCNNPEGKRKLTMQFEKKTIIFEVTPLSSLESMEWSAHGEELV